MCVENGAFLSFSIRGFFYNPRSYMINVLKINCGLLPIGFQNRSYLKSGLKHLFGFVCVRNGKVSPNK